MPSHTERLEGGLVGLLVGDALGVPYEFQAAGAIPERRLIEFEPPPGHEATYPYVPRGTWSDDGAQALCLLESLLHSQGLDPEHLGQTLLRWLYEGHMAVDGKVFDVGGQTMQALARLKSGVRAIETGPDSRHENGNGSLMRVLPLVLWHKGGDEELASLACRQSRVTHGHALSQACCAIYCLWARRVLLQHGVPWNSAVSAARSIWPEGTPLRIELEDSIKPDEPPTGTGSGYVLDCLQSARWAVSIGKSYEDVVRQAIALGHDTDTTACVAGGIAGLHDGIHAIPQRWRSQLRGRALLAPLWDSLRRHHGL